VQIEITAFWPDQTSFAGLRAVNLQQELRQLRELAGFLALAQASAFGA
jgi:hypothetical protein